MRDKSRSVRTTLAFATFHNVLQVYFLPTRFFFTHVLKAVLFGSAVRWLGRPAHMKTKYYWMESWLVDVPILVMTYVEALTCDSFLIRYGGHVWFDMVVPVMFGVYWLILVCQADGTKLKAGSLRQASGRAVSNLVNPPALLRTCSGGLAEGVEIVQRSRGASSGLAMVALRQASLGALCPKSD
jgi:hypothetical protein